MAENSKIEWCDHTFNPWIGCTKVSEGCKHCYAETLMDKRYGRVKWGAQGTRVRTSEANWKKPVAWNKQAEREGRRFLVFCASLADVFERNEQLDPWRGQLWNLIAQTPNLDWLLLTKRPENVNYMAPWGSEAYPWPKNVWIGASVENQAAADERIPELLKVGSYVRFLSVEPLLGAVSLGSIGSVGLGQCLECLGSGETAGHYYQDDGVDTCESCYGVGENDDAYVDWVIVGGESGPEAREMFPEWVRSIRDDCVKAGVPFFFKQWGSAMPDVLQVKGWERAGRNFSEKKGGRLLDGREWNEFPQREVK